MLEPSKNGIAWLDDFTGGLNDTDPPEQIGDNQLQVAQNIEWIATKVAQRRQGGQNNIGTEVWGAAKSVVWLFRHTPSTNENAAELWGMDTSATVVLGRLVTGINWSAITVGDAISNAALADAVSFDGKLFIAYDSAVDRLHHWDGTSFLRTGLVAAAAPTVVNTGAGAYAATQRWYKITWQRSDTGGLFIDSELSTAVSFTPSGAGTAARVTRPSLPGEGEVAWLLYGSPDNINFYFLSSIAAATTTADDSVAPSLYATSTSQPGYPSAADYFTVPPSARYLLVDGARLLMLGSWEVAAYTSRVWWTPVLRSTAPVYFIADSQRVPSANFLDLDPSDGGGLTGAAMFGGSPYAFKLARIYRLNVTTNALKPYTRTVISRTRGAISHRSIVVAEDDEGNDCLYFLGRRGAYRYGPYGMEFLGRDIKTTWKTVNISSTTPPFAVYHADAQQIWWWVATGSSNTPTTVLVLNLQYAKRQENNTTRGGWVTYTGDVAVALAAVMFARVLGATMSLDLKPYVAQVYASGDPDGPVIMYDADGVTADGVRATAYTASLKSKAFNPGGRDKLGGVLEAFVTAQPTGRTLNISAIRNYGETIPGSVAIAAAGTVTRDDQKVENLTCGECKTLELQIDDSGQGSRAWVLDTIGLRLKEEGVR